MFKVAKWILAASSASGGGVVVLDSYDYINLTNYSAMRATRTGITTVKTIVDYKWSLWNVDDQSMDYIKAKSQVGIRYTIYSNWFKTVLNFF